MAFKMKKTYKQAEAAEYRAIVKKFLNKYVEKGVFEWLI